MVCRQDKQLSMAKCCKCSTWIHDDCVGLESADETSLCVRFVKTDIGFFHVPVI
jgi:hypothetical protein